MLLPDNLDRRVNLASASLGMSKAEYVSACVAAGLDTHAAHDDVLRMAFDYARI